jgi:hypothetical protein
MTRNAKIILACVGILVTSAAVYVVSQDGKRKKYYNTVVPPSYALKMIRKK